MCIQIVCFVLLNWVCNKHEKFVFEISKQIYESFGKNALKITSAEQIAEVEVNDLFEGMEPFWH